MISRQTASVLCKNLHRSATLHSFLELRCPILRPGHKTLFPAVCSWVVWAKRSNEGGTMRFVLWL